MRKAVLAVLAVLVGLLPMASSAVQIQYATLFYQYDITNTNFEYPLYVSLVRSSSDQIGSARSIFNPGTKGPARAKASGFTTTLTSFTTGAEAFKTVSVGDLITMVINGVNVERKVASKTSDNQIDLDLEISGDVFPGLGTVGFEFYYKKLAVSASAEEGWFSCRGVKALSVNVAVTTFNATDVQFTLQARNVNAGTFPTGATIASVTMTAVGSAMLPAPGTAQPPFAYEQCRVGVKVTGDLGVNNTYANVIMHREP